MKIKTILLDQTNNLAKNCVYSIGERIRNRGKPCLWGDRGHLIVDVIVIHFVSAIHRMAVFRYDLSEILDIFVEHGVSSHYLISRHGVVYQLVPEEKKAWHCGQSIMPEPDERQNVNEFSLGIELMGTETSGFSESQYNSLILLCRDIEYRYKREFTYVGHDQIAGLKAVEKKVRDTAKTDPGPLFDWERFYIGIEKSRVSMISEA